MKNAIVSYEITGTGGPHGSCKSGNFEIPHEVAIHLNKMDVLYPDGGEFDCILFVDYKAYSVESDTWYIYVNDWG